jgi:hypothetical protein
MECQTRISSVPDSLCREISGSAQNDLAERKPRQPLQKAQGSKRESKSGMRAPKFYGREAFAWQSWDFKLSMLCRPT